MDNYKSMSKQTGRPRIEVDWEELNKLCALQCTLREIASWFDCSEDTIERRVKEKSQLAFAVYARQKGEKGKISLRRRQWKLSEKHVAMAIWLGKQYLGQSDKQEQTINSEIKINIDKQDTNL